MHRLKSMLVLLALSSLAFTACTSVDYQGNLIVVEEQVSDIHLRVSLLDRISLQEKYGKEDNPFIDYPGMMPPRHFFVFEAEISTEESTVEFEQQTIKLQVGSDVNKSYNAFTLKKEWEPYYDDDNQKLHMGMTMNKVMKPTKFTVSPGNPHTALLVFLVKPNEARESTLIIPARTPEGDEGVLELSFPIIKMLDGKEEIPSENTGIFK